MKVQARFAGVLSHNDWCGRMIVRCSRVVNVVRVGQQRASNGHEPYCYWPKKVVPAREGSNEVEVGRPYKMQLVGQAFESEASNCW